MNKKEISDEMIIFQKNVEMSVCFIKFICIGKSECPNDQAVFLYFRFKRQNSKQYNIIP